jgi:hypothetical protein
MAPVVRLPPAGTPPLPNMCQQSVPQPRHHVGGGVEDHHVVWQDALGERLAGYRQAPACRQHITMRAAELAHSTDAFKSVARRAAAVQENNLYQVINHLGLTRTAGTLLPRSEMSGRMRP